MSIIDNLKSAVRFLQIAAAAAVTIKLTLKELYQLFYPSEERNKPNGEDLVSHSFSSTEISEEIMIFKDENGDMKTVISRKVRSKSSLPDHLKIANDNDDSLQLKDPASHVRQIAESICANDNNSENCRQMLGEIQSAPPDSEAAA